MSKVLMFYARFEAASITMINNSECVRNIYASIILTFVKHRSICYMMHHVYKSTRGAASWSKSKLIIQTVMDGRSYFLTK